MILGYHYTYEEIQANDPLFGKKILYYICQLISKVGKPN